LPLHRFLSLLESRAEFSCPSRLLDESIDAPARRALCEAGVLVPGGPITWYPCAQRFRGCRRTVAADGARLHLLCDRPGGGCPAEILDAQGQDEHVLDEAALVRVVQKLFDIAEQPVRRDGHDEALWLGQARPGDPHVWLWLRPREPDFAFWLRRLEDTLSGSAALVLVPTPAFIHPDTFDRYGAGQPIRVVHLSRSLTLVDGRFVRAEAAGPAPARALWQPGALVERRGTIVRLPAGTTWRDVTIEYVNDDVVAVRVGQELPVRVTAAELGLVHEATGAAGDRWQLLVALCAERGTCTRGAVGAASMDAFKKRVHRLAARLCEVFGLRDLPLHVDSETESVRADFHALPEPRRTTARRRS
jgi:hypothetical protein